MKILLYILSLFVIVVLCSFVPQVDPLPFKFTWHTIIAILAGLYELIVRLIPTVANYSFIGKIIDMLKWISDFLNRKKKK